MNATPLCYQIPDPATIDFSFAAYLSYLSQAQLMQAQSPIGPQSSTRTLHPVKGGLIGQQARRVLGRDPELPGMVTLPGALTPYHLPSLSPPGLAGLGSPEGKGRPATVTYTPGSFDEGAVAVPFSHTQPLQSLGPLPPTGGGLRLPRRRPTMDLPITMPSRRKMADPFSMEPLSPIQPTPVGTLPPSLGTRQSSLHPDTHS